ncbi:MAG: zinc ribbon domain-containing protein [Anaerolineae bacterium]|nr:zinc ribbon domain-containing protein [Anaerolineae bacterium]
MIIFGTRPRGKTIDSGEFYCPHCRALRRYELKESRPYFTLYFLPVFPVGEARQYVQCETCGTAFTPDILKTAPPEVPPDLATLLNRLIEQLAGGQPLEYAIRDLTAAGLEFDIARRMVNEYAGDGRKVCTACGLTYAAPVARCTQCGGPLQAAS